MTQADPGQSALVFFIRRRLLQTAKVLGQAPAIDSIGVGGAQLGLHPLDHRGRGVLALGLGLEFLLELGLEGGHLGFILLGQLNYESPYPRSLPFPPPSRH